MGPVWYDGISVSSCSAGSFCIYSEFKIHLITITEEYHTEIWPNNRAFPEYGIRKSRPSQLSRDLLGRCNFVGLFWRAAHMIGSDLPTCLISRSPPKTCATTALHRRGLTILRLSSVVHVSRVLYMWVCARTYIGVLGGLRGGVFLLAWSALEVNVRAVPSMIGTCDRVPSVKGCLV